MALTAAIKTELYQFFAIAFDAAPGTTYMDQLTQAVDAGMSVQDIVEVFTSKLQFTSVYPESASSADFATLLINNVVGDSASAAAKAEAVADVEGALAAGWTRGQVIYQIFSNLAAKPEDDATWGGTSKMMANQVAVAQYATEVQLVSTANLYELRALIADVTDSTDVSTPAAIASVIATGVAAAIPGLTFSLTNSATADAPFLTAGNDTVTGATGTLQSIDRLLDASATDTDVLNVTVSGYTAGAVEPTMMNIETVNINGQYTTVGFDLTNASGIKNLNLSAGVANSTATVDDAAATKSAAITAGSNVSVLNVNTLAAGTTGNVVVNAGSATTVALVGGVGADDVTLNAAAASTLTLTSGTTSTRDVLTVNLNGGANTATFGTANGWDTLTINSKTAANTLTLADATEIAAVGTTNKLVVGGDKALTIVGDGDAIAGASRTDGVAIEKAAGAGTLTLTSNAPLTAPAFFNRALLDVLNLTTAIGATQVTVNEATTVKLSFDQTSAAAVTYDVDNNGDTAITANTGTLKLDVAASQSANGLRVGAGVGAVQMSATTANVVVAGYDTGTVANTIETTALTGNKNVTITEWTNDADDIISADGFTGVLTVGSMTAKGVMIGGSGNDSLTVGVNVEAVIRGGAGNDVINGSAATGARVSLFGDAGDDNLTGGGVADVLDGGDGNDLLTAGDGADTVSGGAGVDTIAGGLGADILTGGADADVFQFDGNTAAATASATNFDTITDWTAGDKIDWDVAVSIVSGSSAASTVAAISATGLATFHANDNTLALKLIAVEAGIAASGTATDGQAAVFVDGSDSYLFISNSTDGIESGDVLIKLTGVQVATGLSISGTGDIISIV